KTPKPQNPKNPGLDVVHFGAVEHNQYLTPEVCGGRYSQLLANAGTKEYIVCARVMSSTLRRQHYSF
ncbi:MAG: hypothetical protein P4L51_20490, partial [Puia sp.]|nr:hypothetical protein [Puia sp.]